jgi:hypothetical protein
MASLAPYQQVGKFIDHGAYWGSMLLRGQRGRQPERREVSCGCTYPGPWSWTWQRCGGGRLSVPGTIRHS